MNTICNCCDDLWHKQIGDGLTDGDYFYMLEILAGGFNMKYVNVELNADHCGKISANKLLKMGFIKTGKSVFSLTQKGIKYIREKENF
jgi:hypothetical protein